MDQHKTALAQALRLIVVAAFLPATAVCSTIVLTADIDGSQEVPARPVNARGRAVMLYDTETNTFDLEVRLQKFTETLSASHIHIAPAGVNGPIVVGIGGEADYDRKRNTLHIELEGQTFPGDPLVLFQGGMYVNFHTPTYPGGAIRGQLAVKNAHVFLFARINGAQEVPPTGDDAFGFALMRYNVVDNTFDLLVDLFRFDEALAASHIHEAPVGVNGGVVVGLGGESSYVRRRNNLRLFLADQPYTGDPIALLTGGAYVNFHTATFPGGAIRGQLLSDLCRN